MNLQVQCISKTERMEGQEIVADVALQPYYETVQTGEMYAQGAQVGTPNAPQQQVQVPQQAKIVLNGGFTLQIRDQEEAKRYSVGGIYSINFGVNEAKAESTPKTGSNKTA